jgi:hypothetical protein
MDMKKIILFLIVSSAIGFSSCKKDEFHNTDTHVGISDVTVYPTFKMSGERYVSIVKGNNFTEPGVTATEGSTNLQVTTSGSVDINKVGVYDIVYSATNKDGFSGSVTRTVAVLPSAENAGVDISGKYDNVGSFTYTATVQKLAPGFYVSDNIWGGGSAAVIASYLITVDGTNIIIPYNALGPYGPVQGSGTLDNAGNLTLKVDLINFGISGSTRKWKKQ